MHTSIIAAMAISLGLSSAPALTSSAPADGPVLEGKETVKGKSLKEATDKIKTDAGKAKDDIKAMDLKGTKQDAGNVKEDAMSLKDSAEGMMKKPFGK
jgi:hypothetical protein